MQFNKAMAAQKVIKSFEGIYDIDNDYLAILEFFNAKIIINVFNVAFS